MASEPVVPFMQVMVPALALTGSILVLAAAVIVKSAFFAVFERNLPRLRAAWGMFVGNVLTSFVGLLVRSMIASELVFGSSECHWLAFCAGCHHEGQASQEALCHHGRSCDHA
jgi:hypothetical protein